LSLLPRQPFLSPPAATLPRPPRLPTVPPATTLGADLRDRSQMKHHSTAKHPRASAAAAVVGIGRNPPWKPTVRPNATRTSSSKFSLVSPPNRSSKAPGAQQECKRDLRGVEAIEVRGIHHRASHSFRTTKGDSAEFSAEV
ncbi:hypothetical protein Prudu_008277, partial [Prunus dulcis]